MASFRPPLWQELEEDEEFKGLSSSEKLKVFDTWTSDMRGFASDNGLDQDEEIQGQFSSFVSQKRPLFLETAKVEETPSLGKVLVDQFASGNRAFGQGVEFISAATGLSSDLDASAQKIADLELANQDVAQTEDMKKFQEAEGFFESAAQIITNPIDVALPLFAQSMGSQIAPMAAGAAIGAGAGAITGPGAAVTGLVGAGLGAGVGDAVVSFPDFIRAKGYDLTDPEQVKAALNDPDVIAEAGKKSAARGLVVGATSAFGGAVAGKPLSAAVAASAGKAVGERAVKIGTGAIADAALQTGIEGLGEAGAQLVSTGKLDPKEIAAEMFVQTPTQVAEIAIGTAARIKDTAPQTAAALEEKGIEKAQEAVGNAEILESVDITPDEESIQRQAEDLDEDTALERAGFITPPDDTTTAPEVDETADVFANVPKQQGLRETVVSEGIAEDAADDYITNLRNEGFSDNQIRTAAANNRTVLEEAARVNEAEAQAKADLARRARAGNAEARAQLEAERGIAATPVVEAAPTPVAEETAPVADQPQEPAVNVLPTGTDAVLPPQRMAPQELADDTLTAPEVDDTANVFAGVQKQQAPSSSGVGVTDTPSAPQPLAPELAAPTPDAQAYEDSLVAEAKNAGTKISGTTNKGIKDAIQGKGWYPKTNINKAIREIKDRVQRRLEAEAPQPAQDTAPAPAPALTLPEGGPELIAETRSTNSVPSSATINQRFEGAPVEQRQAVRREAAKQVASDLGIEYSDELDFAKDFDGNDNIPIRVTQTGTEPVFVNNPEVTARQIDAGFTPVVPEAMRGRVVQGITFDADTGQVTSAIGRGVTTTQPGDLARGVRAQRPGTQSQATLATDKVRKNARPFFNKLNEQDQRDLDGIRVALQNRTASSQEIAAAFGPDDLIEAGLIKWARERVKDRTLAKDKRKNYSASQIWNFVMQDAAEKLKTMPRTVSLDAPITETGTMTRGDTVAAQDRMADRESAKDAADREAAIEEDDAIDEGVAADEPTNVSGPISSASTGMNYDQAYNIINSPVTKGLPKKAVAKLKAEAQELLNLAPQNVIDDLEANDVDYWTWTAEDFRNVDKGDTNRFISSSPRAKDPYITEQVSWLKSVTRALNLRRLSDNQQDILAKFYGDKYRPFFDRGNTRLPENAVVLDLPQLRSIFVGPQGAAPAYRAALDQLRGSFPGAKIVYNTTQNAVAWTNQALGRDTIFVNPLILEQELSGLTAAEAYPFLNMVLFEEYIHIVETQTVPPLLVESIAVNLSPDVRKKVIDEYVGPLNRFSSELERNELIANLDNLTIGSEYIRMIVQRLRYGATTEDLAPQNLPKTIFEQLMQVIKAIYAKLEAQLAVKSDPLLAQQVGRIEKGLRVLETRRKMADDPTFKPRPREIRSSSPVSPGSQPPFIFKTRAELEKVLSGKGGVFKGLTPDKDGKIPWQNLLAKVKKSFRQEEAQLVETMLSSMAVDGKVDVANAVAALDVLSNSMARIVDLPVTLTQPKTAQQQDGNPDRESIIHQLDTFYPDWLRTPELYQNDDIYATLTQQLEDIDASRDFVTSQPATQRFARVNPRPLEEMQDAGDILIEEPYGKQLKRALVSGKIEFDEMIPGVTMVTEVDTSSGKVVRRVISDDPYIDIINPETQEVLDTIELRPGDTVFVSDGSRVNVGDPVVRGLSEEKYEDSGGHYPKRANIIGFGRKYTVTLPNGEPATFVFEVQSDWKGTIKKQLNEGKLTPGVERYAATVGNNVKLFNTEAEAEQWVAREQRSQQPLLSVYETLVLKAAIREALARGQTTLVVTDADTAIVTEGHDIQYNQVRTVDYTIAPTRQNIDVANELLRASNRQARIEEAVAMAWGQSSPFTYDEWLENPRLKKDVAERVGQVLERLKQLAAGQVVTESETLLKAANTSWSDIFSNLDFTEQKQYNYGYSEPAMTRTRAGMDAAYGPSSGRLHQIMRKLTGDKGMPVDLGEHGRLIFNADQAEERSEGGELKSALQKNNITGIAYNLSDVLENPSVLRTLFARPGNLPKTATVNHRTEAEKIQLNKNYWIRPDGRVIDIYSEAMGRISKNDSETSAATHGQFIKQWMSDRLDKFHPDQAEFAMAKRMSKSIEELISNDASLIEQMTDEEIDDLYQSEVSSSEALDLEVPDRDVFFAEMRKQAGATSIAYVQAAEESGWARVSSVPHVIRRRADRNNLSRDSSTVTVETLDSALATGARRTLSELKGMKQTQVVEDGAVSKMQGVRPTNAMWFRNLPDQSRSIFASPQFRGFSARGKRVGRKVEYKPGGLFSSGLFTTTQRDIIQKGPQKIAKATANAEFLLKEFRRAIKKAYGKNPAPAELINQALGSTENRLTDQQVADLKKIRDKDAREVQRLQYMSDNRNQARLDRDTALAQLPAPVAKAVGDFGAKIDELSLEMRNGGYIADDLIPVFDENLGLFIHRSYAIFESPQWRDNMVRAGEIADVIREIKDPVERQKAISELPKTTREHVRVRVAFERFAVERAIAEYATEIRRKAKQNNQTLSRQQAIALAKADTDTISRKASDLVLKYLSVADQDAYQFFTSGRSIPGRRNLDIIKVRGQVPKELREFWGEVKDAETNFTQTVSKMAAFMAHHDVATELLNNGIAEGFIWKAGISKTPNPNPEYVPLIPKGTASPDSISPLYGAYGPKELQQALLKMIEPKTTAGFYRFMSFMTASAMAMKTIGYVPRSFVRNFLGNPLIALGRGLFDLSDPVSMGKALADGFRVFRLNAGLGGNTAYQALRERALELGVIGDNIRGTLIKKLYEESTEGEKIKELLKRSEFDSALEKIGVRVGQGLYKGASKLADIYQGVDDIWKVYAWEMEQKRQKAAHPTWDARQIEEAAAQNVRNLMPTYSLSPEITQRIRRVPVFAPFFTWTSEMIRTTGNNLALGKQEISEGLRTNNKAMVANGSARLGGFLTAVTILPAFAMAMKAAMGYDDEDEEAVRTSLRDWQKNNQLIFLGSKDQGKVSFIDLSYLDPNQIFAEPVIAASRAFKAGDNPITAWAKETLKPLYSEQLFIGAMADIMRNRTADGLPIVNEQDTMANQLYGKMAHVTEAIGPGTLVTTIPNMIRGAKGEISRSSKVYSLTDEVYSAAFGQKISEVDAQTSLRQAAGRFMSSNAEATRLLNDTLLSRGTVDVADIPAAYENANRAKRDLFEKLRDNYNAAIKLGVPRNQAVLVMRSMNVSQDLVAQVINDRFIDYAPVKQTLNEVITRPDGKKRLTVLRDYLLQKRKQDRAQNEG